MNKQGYDQEALARRIRDLRRKSGLKQKDLAREIGVNCSTACLHESGKRQPHLSNIILMADYFGVTVEELVGREDLLEKRGWTKCAGGSKRWL